MCDFCCQTYVCNSELFYYFSCHFSHSNSLKGYKEDEASTPAPAPLLYLEPSSTTPATPQAAVLLPAAREQKVTPVCKDDIDCGNLNLCIAQLKKHLQAYLFINDFKS